MNIRNRRRKRRAVEWKTYGLENESRAQKRTAEKASGAFQNTGIGEVDSDWK